MGSEWYVLGGDDGRTPVPCSVNDYGKRFKQWKNRHVRRESLTVPGGVVVDLSTVFLGLDHSCDFDGPPLLFETMVFGGAHDRSCERCSTWAEAESVHERWKAKLIAGEDPNE